MTSAAVVSAAPGCLMECAVSEILAPGRPRLAQFLPRWSSLAALDALGGELVTPMNSEVEQPQTRPGRPGRFFQRSAHGVGP